MTEREQAVMPFPTGSSGLPEQIAAYDDFTSGEDWPASSVPGLVSLGFIKAAIRRSLRFCLIMAVIGLLVGAGLYVAFPASYQATASLLITNSPYEDSNTAVNDDQAMVQSRTVAELAMHDVGIREDPGAFLASYKATVVTNRVLLLTLSAPSASQALLRTNAVAKEFLQYRANQLQTEAKLVLASLQQQATQAKQRVDTINAQISNLSGEPASAGQRAQLNTARAQLLQANATLVSLQQAVSGNLTSSQPQTAAAVKGSQLLDSAALLPHSRLKHLLLYPVAGFLAGLVIGLAIVVIRALVSDRLRRREDIAQALGAPVKLSVVRGRRRPGRHGLVASDADIDHIAAYLTRAVPANSRFAAALAVIPVDDPQVAARALVSMGVAAARQGKQVVLADLAPGAPAAKLLGVTEPGVSEVQADNARLVLAVPDPDEITPAGPLGRVPGRGHRSAFTEAAMSAAAPADMLLTLVPLDPSLGADHLSGWTSDAVVVITAGESSWLKLNAVGEMVRLGGVQRLSAVLVGADKDDESLGVVGPESADAAAAPRPGMPREPGGAREAGQEAATSSYAVAFPRGPKQGQTSDNQ